MLVLALLGSAQAHAASDAPYFTYTSDSDGYTIRTQDAYTPGQQIGQINGQRLDTPEHVFVDSQDYVYVTDSVLNKVFILDSKLRFYKELASDKFSGVKSTFVTEASIYAVDAKAQKILVFDKESLALTAEIGKPDSPIFAEGYEFSPTNVAVDVRGNIYVRSAGSTYGLILLNREGEFITFFGANPLKVPLMDQLRSAFLTKTQKDKLAKALPDVPSNIAIDKKGFLYTVTSSVETNPIKKFNVSGKNYFPDDIVGMFSMESVWIGRHNTVFSVSSDGWIFEYDANGNLLFMFGGKDFNSSRLGLLNRPVSIASNSADELLVVDQGTKMIQTYRPSEFSHIVHQAMDAYQDGDYAESRKQWQHTLHYNSTFDKAHIGLGEAYLRSGEADLAYREFEEVGYKPGLSESFWEIRQIWLRDHLGLVFGILLGLMALRYAHKWANRTYGYAARAKERLKAASRRKFLHDFLLIFRILKHPLDSLYEIKYENRGSRLSATLIYALIFVLLIAHHEFASRLFVDKQGYFLHQLWIILGFAVLWVVSNYLVCSISDGEGSFREVYIATAYALSPLIVILPPLILASNGFTLEQSIFYELPIQAMTLWIAFLMFFMIKDIHSYEVGETVGVVFKSAFTMLIVGLFLFVLYSLGSQLLGFGQDVITEAGKRW
ncbi:YIP1 family protein [Paenibacillus sp. FSL W8-1187]|uniref:NHL repeat containing protein n=1 Tax=Paenibacillus pasadenensis TaxID=217090 RepID=A0A2N5NCN4_9BACL|nr:YIP1 family protein [Paenibacillus pasadenensis]PLT48094.1 NHL repeat containing protein [Paenibacillus pasadenensis]